MTKLHFSLFVIIGILSIPIQKTYAKTQKTYSCKACPPGTVYNILDRYGHYTKPNCKRCPSKTYNPNYGQSVCKSCFQRDPYMETCDNKTGWSKTCKKGYVVNSFGYCTEESSYKMSANERGSNTGGSIHY